MNRIAVLIACFNRKDRTLKCLQNLFRQDVPVDVFLVDDGCTDGTPEAVASHFPRVNIIKGNGDLYWNRGMYAAWTEAEKGDYDFYLWLNDDTYLYDGALKMILDMSASQNHRAVIVGAICSVADRSLAFDGDRYRKKPVYPNGELQQCDVFAGNCVLVPRSVYVTCGKLDPYYRHGMGDTDYSWTVREKGLRAYLTPKYAGEFNLDKETVWADFSKPLFRRYRDLFLPLSFINPREVIYFHRKHENIFSAVAHALFVFYKVTFEDGESKRKRKNKK